MSFEIGDKVYLVDVDKPAYQITGIEIHYRLRPIDKDICEETDFISKQAPELYKSFHKIIWTTAPVDYDYSYCTTERTIMLHNSKEWRQVRIESFQDKKHLDYIVNYQRGRYQSGMHPVYEDRDNFQQDTGIRL